MRWFFGTAAFIFYDFFLLGTKNFKDFEDIILYPNHTIGELQGQSENRVEKL
jgi:hypothetical protein